MNKNIFRAICLLLVAALIACDPAEEGIFNNNITQDTTYTFSGNNKNVEANVIRVKLSSEVGDFFEVYPHDGMARSTQATMDTYLQSIGAESMQRVFPFAGEFEKRTRKEGFHLWYDITFDVSRSVTRAASGAYSLPGVDIVEIIDSPTLSPFRPISVNPITTRSSEGYFNDPLLSSQWHFHNNGSIPGSVAGADINLLKAWEMETGKPTVVVSIVDGGIDIAHEDLKDNLWINEVEFHGLPGVDDDGNGYVDDIYGYNFVSYQGTILPHDHGTHVGGTVAARNNNAKGVASVAGGNGMQDSGVRIMSSQIFESTSNPEVDRAGNAAAAIKYGADNGAIISQNSWGYEYPGLNAMPASLKAAIDYFIKYAGCDADGNQLPDSPMKGGVVLFAAGNDNKDFVSYPAAYPPVISVSAMAPDYRKAWYSNRGDWITLMAPGGDQYFLNGMVLSTLANNRYGFLQGTSMASPHVAGIAALIVSKFGGPGFTNETLKERIVNSLLPIDIDEMNPDYKGKLGKGYIDAEKALLVNNQQPPEMVDSVYLLEGPSHIVIEWQAVKDHDDGTASLYRLYYSDTSLDVNNFHDAAESTIHPGAHQAGATLRYIFESPVFEKEYHFALIAEDRWGLQSGPIFFSGKTKMNYPPELTRLGNGTIRLTENETATVIIEVEEPEGQEWTYQFSGETAGITSSREVDKVALNFSATAPVGFHVVTITVTDVFDASNLIDIPFEVYVNKPPVQIKELEELFIMINENNFSLNLSEYFTDEDGHEIFYSARSNSPTVANVQATGDLLTITPLTAGVGSLRITARDTHNAQTSILAQFRVVTNELIYFMYPVPVSTSLYIRLGNSISEANIRVTTTQGKAVLQKTVMIHEIDERTINLDVSRLAPASYILHVESQDKQFTQLFIKH